MTTWQARVLTLYPEMFPGPMDTALAGKALSKGVWALDVVDIREYARDKHGTVDGAPSGGGPGMVLRADILADALDVSGEKDEISRPSIVLTPRGRPLTQERVKALAVGPGVTLICGRFEGIDQRVIEARELEEISVGDAVLSGGEIAAMMVLDACVRLLPGVMGDAASMEQESFEGDLLEFPQYTLPRQWEGYEIPEVLLSGHHGKIAEWRQKQAEADTKSRRPDLWDRYKARQDEND